MPSVDPSIDFEEALERLREGYSDDYEGWLHGMNDALDVARDHGWGGTEFVGNPRVQHAIWRYQHFDADQVRREIEVTLERNRYDVDVDEAIKLLRAVAEEM